MDPRPRASLGSINVHHELAYLRADSDPPWERPHRDGVDVTDDPTAWTPYQRQRRIEYEARVADYRQRGLI